MKIAAFTIVKNAIKYHYPIVESIQSVLPLCDAFYVSVGDSDDDTWHLIKAINDPKIIMLPSVWDKTMTKNGEVLAFETNKVFQQIPQEYTWCIYIQADELIHEKDFEKICSAMQKYKDDTNIQGLLFSYHHFWGSYDYITNTSGWYKNEIRIIKNNKNIFSYKDAQGFRIKPNEKIQVAHTRAYIYHYGWVRPPKQMQDKYKDIQQYWSNENKFIADVEEYDYSGIDSLSPFKDTHPIWMKNLVEKQNWTFDFDTRKKKLKFKEHFKQFLFRLTGRHFFEYKNYKLIK
ncbi:MAG: glycosyltransferase family 2 protein [Chitinophagaceae bacterium]